MSSIIIETLQSDSRWVAVVSKEDENTESAGVAWATTEALAAAQAVTNYFRRAKVLADAREAIKIAGESHPAPTTIPVTQPVSEQWEIAQGIPISTSKVVGVTPRDIRRILNDAIHKEDDVLVTGTKVNNENYTNRRISPYRIKRMLASNRELVQFSDPSDNNLLKGFYLDSITRVELA